MSDIKPVSEVAQHLQIEPLGVDLKSYPHPVRSPPSLLPVSSSLFPISLHAKIVRIILPYFPACVMPRWSFLSLDSLRYGSNPSNNIPLRTEPKTEKNDQRIVESGTLKV
jgi:hypothetical protein